MCSGEVEKNEMIKNIMKRLVFLIKKETSTQVFSCEYCKIFQNSFFYITPPGSDNTNIELNPLMPGL